MSKYKKQRGRKVVFERSDYKELKAFNDQLLDEKSKLGSIISHESLRRSSENIHRAVVQTIVNNGHGVILQEVP